MSEAEIQARARLLEGVASKEALIGITRELAENLEDWANGTLPGEYRAEPNGSRWRLRRIDG